MGILEKDGQAVHKQEMDASGWKGGAGAEVQGEGVYKSVGGAGGGAGIIQDIRELYGGQWGGIMRRSCRELRVDGDLYELIL